MRAYSLDLRQRIVRAVQTGHPKAEVAKVFGVDRRTINRYLRLDAAGDVSPKPIPGRPRAITADQQADLELQLRLHPADTLAEHCQRWAARHTVSVSVATMSRMIARLGWTRKKDAGSPRT
ncbi:MAG: IS630 transposase-related protein [Thermomicrobiales bacterium]